MLFSQRRPGRKVRGAGPRLRPRTRTRSLTDRASDYGSEGCRFESCRVHSRPEALRRNPEGLSRSRGEQRQNPRQWAGNRVPEPVARVSTHVARRPGREIGAISGRGVHEYQGRKRGTCRGGSGLGCGAERADSPRERGQASSSVTSSAEGRFSSEELQRRWWTWVAAEPERTNPVADLDGSSCGRNQPRDVWFLVLSVVRSSGRAASPVGCPSSFLSSTAWGSPPTAQTSWAPPRGRRCWTARGSLRRNTKGRRSSCGGSPTTPSRDRRPPSWLPDAVCGSSWSPWSPGSTR